MIEMPTTARNQHFCLNLPGPPLAGQLLQDPLPGEVDEMRLPLAVDAEFGRVLVDLCNATFHFDIAFLRSLLPASQRRSSENYDDESDLLSEKK